MIVRSILDVLPFSGCAGPHDGVEFQPFIPSLSSEIRSSGGVTDVPRVDVCQ